ncbi:hypothetical protein I2I11_20845 [Pontibacter sp. 172403-2]|uniref:hypothetical protein n=1 Tax=Pontibacter rufus TaxID=2791028 RepID=UPI0018AF80A7|nr:hypothetical protein [Pontibacter sp. 172403-2]MBF9255759.1 hypothetical protein [Pontibacter sp. 172403-2]
MKLIIEKPKTKRGMSYALQTSLLKEVLEDLQVDNEVLLKYWTPNHFHDGYPIFSCELWLPNQRVNYERYYIQVCPVKSEDKKIVEDLLKQKVLPEFITWLRKIVALPDNSTHFNQGIYFKAFFNNNQVALTSSG